jgi:hypothetical protein
MYGEQKNSYEIVIFDRPLSFLSYGHQFGESRNNEAF